MIKVGVVYPQVELRGDPEAVRLIGLATEDLGYDHLAVYDHVVAASHDRQPQLTGPYDEFDPFHDPFVMFGYLAGLTSRIGFATSILILPQRQTVLVARQATDVDLFSGGRLRLGVGVGWNYVEYDALGQDFHTRGRRSAEQIRLLRRLWSEPLITFSGEFDQIDAGGILPRPGRQIPIWLGGSNVAAFRRAAELGDGFIFTGPFDQCVKNLGLVQQELANAGRPRDGFGMQLAVRAESPQQTVAEVAKWEELGGTHAAVTTMQLGLDSAEAHIDLLGRVRAELDRG